MCQGLEDDSYLFFLDAHFSGSEWFTSVGTVDYPLVHELRCCLVCVYMCVCVCVCVCMCVVVSVRVFYMKMFDR
jgi:hypothetical protein